MISRIWKEEKNTVIGLFISVLAGMLLITTIWKNDYTEDIPFGILDEDRSSLSQSIVKQFGINPSLDIVYYADSEQDLKQAILDKKIEAGVMIPENFSRDMSLKKSPQAVIFADCSNIITGGGAVGAASSVLGTMSAGMQLKMLEGNNFYPSAAQTSLGTFSYVDRTLYEPQGDYIRKMSYLLVPAITMQTFLISFFIPLMIRKRKALAAAAPEKRGEELKDGIIRTAVVAGGAVAAQFVVLCVVGLYKNIPLRGEIGLYLFSTVLFMLAAVAFGGVGLPLALAMLLRPKHFPLWYVVQLVKGISVLAILLSLISLIGCKYGVIMENDDIMNVVRLWPEGRGVCLVLLCAGLLLSVGSICAARPVQRVGEYFGIAKK